MGREGVGLRWWQRLTRRYLAFCQELLVQKESIVAAIGEGFGKWARICYRYPYHVMLASLVLCVAMASGLLPPTPVWIDGAEKLYSLPYSRARDDGTLHTSYFGDVLGRKSVVILKHKVEGSNILTWKYLEAIQHLDAIIRGREVDPVGSRKLVIPRTFGDQNDNIFSQSEGKQETEKAVQESNRSAGHASDDALNSGTLSNNSRHPRGSHSSTGMDDRGYMTFEDICLMNPFGECAIDSVLKFGLHELRQMGFLPGEPEVWVFDGTVYNTKQVGFIPEYFLGGITKEQCWRQMPLELAQRLLPSSRIRPLPDQPGFAMVDIDCITKAQAAMLQYDADGRSQFEGRNMMWERLFIQIMKDNQSFGDLEVSFQAFRSRDDELRASTSESKDVVYVVFTFFILATYSTALNFSCDLYRNKLFSALMGFGAAFMGLGAGMGIVAYMGMPMVPTVLICPFLVLGIGVDDMFVVMNCYCVSYTIHDPEERCIQALRISGLGISITTLTNLISFGVGAFSAYMSIRNFCVYSAMALFMGYVFVLTFFFPTLCIDARREECARVCPFCLPDISDRQKVAQERLAEMTDEERKIVESMASLSQEELIAYKVNVFYEEQAIRKATRQRRDLGERGRTAEQARPDGPTRFIRRLAEALTVHRPLPPPPSPSASFRSALPSQSMSVNGGSANSGQGSAPNPRSTSATSTAPLPPTVPSGSASSHWGQNVDGSETRKTKFPSVSGAYAGGDITKHGEKNGLGRDTKSFVSGRIPREGKDDAIMIAVPKLATTIGGLPPDLAREALYEEPRGNVGRKWREFFLCYYGPLLMWFPVKVAVVVAFVAIAAVSVYGFTKLELGLELSELAPGNSYMRRFDADFAHYFNKFDQPTDIFFVDRKKRPANSNSSYGVAGDSPLSSSAPPRRLFIADNPLQPFTNADAADAAFYSGHDRGDIAHYTQSPIQVAPELQIKGELGTPSQKAASREKLSPRQKVASVSGQISPSLSVSPPTLRGATMAEHASQMDASSFLSTESKKGQDNSSVPLEDRNIPEANTVETKTNSEKRVYSLDTWTTEETRGRRLVGTNGEMAKERSETQATQFGDSWDKVSSSIDKAGGNSVDDMSIRTEWWNPKVQAALRAFHKKLESRPTTSRLVNPLLTMLDDPQIGAKLRMGDKQVFEDTIYYQLVHSKSPYRQFKFDFIWTGRELKTWRMRLLPKYMATSEERASWMQQLRNDCDEAAKAFVEISEGDNNEEVEYASSNQKSSSVSLTDKASSAWGTTRDDLGALPGEPIYPIAYTYMMIFYESDLGILSSVLINMLSAGLAMLLVAFVLIPEALAGFLVILMICLIDLALFGFMYFWRVKLHMVSTIALVISIGFAVDYSAHLCHTFTHCKGETREKRVIESLVLMGNPIFHGASSTLLGIMLLGFSESFVFTVFFRMMVMVVAFGASHGMLLLPVILSWIGPMGHTDHGKALESSTSCADLSGEGTVSRPEKPHQLHSKLPKDQFIPSVPFPQHLSHPAEENTSKTNPTLLTSKLRPEASRSGGAPNVLGAAEAEKNAENSHVGRWFLAKMLPKASSGGDRQQIGSETFGSLQGTDEGASFVIDTTGHRRPVVHPRAASLPVPLPVRSLPASLDVQSFRQTHANPHNLADHCFLPYSDQKVRVSADDTAAALRPSGPWAHGDEEPTSSCISSPLDYTAHQQARQLKAHRRSRLLEGQIPNSVENSEANRGTLHGVSSTTASGLPSHPLETASAELELAPMIASSQAAAALSQLREKLWNSVASSRTSTGSGVFLQNKEIYPMASQRCTQRKRSSHESRIGEMKGCCEETQGGEDGREMREPKVCVPLVKEPPFPSVASEVSSAAFSESTTGATNNPDLKKHIVAHPRRVMSCGPTLSLQPSLKSSSVVSSQHPSLVSGNASSISHSKRRNSAVAGKPSISTAYHSGTATIGGQPVITVRKGIGVVGFPHPGCTSIAGARSGQRRHSTSKGASSGQNLPSLVSNRLPRPPKNGTPHDTQNSRSSDVVGHGFPAAAEELDTGGRRTANSEVGSGAKRSHSTNSVNLGRTPREREPHTRPGSHTFGLVHSSSLPSNVARDGECKHTPLPPASRSSSAVSTTFANTSTHNARPKSQNSPVSYVSSHASKKLILPPTHLATSHQRGRSSQNHSQPTHVMGKADQDKGQALESVSSLDAPAGSASKRRNSTGNLMANRGRRELGVVSASGHSETEQKRGESRQQRSGRRDTRDPSGQGMEAGDERTEDEISKPGCGKEEYQTKGGGLFQQLLQRGMSLRKTRDEGPLA
uniref:Patched family domain containing protein n=1 Tax=Toxoplasma gondii (strain ATCC 50861 / VEG) TaxID=432359 RepID=A0A0F7US74_TOXGV|nr:TPA: Patched family domain containing protein [Toxoplasma gondii VEG]